MGEEKRRTDLEVLKGDLDIDGERTAFDEANIADFDILEMGVRGRSWGGGDRGLYARRDAACTAGKTWPKSLGKQR